MGGVFGALVRFYLGTSIQQLTMTGFPYGTLTVNLLGSFLLSFIAYGSTLLWKLPRNYLLAINTGCIGSFTTFSTFSVETINLLEQGNFLAALVYVIISVAGGLALSWMGIRMANKFYI
ncbi:fluoride efflux transporter CrcB [Desulfotomaculum defluvii]